MRTEPANSRSLDRRRVYIGEGLSFQIESETAWLEAEAIDLTHEGLGVAVVLATDVMMPAVGEAVTVRYTGRGASGDRQRAVARHVGRLQTGRGTLPRIGLSLVADMARIADVDRREGVRYPCPEALAAFAAASCPWFFGETQHFRIVQIGAGGMTLRTAQPHLPLPPRAEVDFDLHLASIAHSRCRARLTSGAWSRSSPATTPHRTPTTRRSSPCACTPIRQRGISTARRPATCARPGMDLLARLDRGRGLGNASRDAFAGSAGAIVLRAPAVDRAALVASGRGLMRLWLEATRHRLAIHPWGSPFLFQRLLEDGDSLEGWERTALTGAAGAFERVVGLNREHPVLLILRVSRGDPPSVRSLRRPVDEVLAFAA